MVPDVQLSLHFRLSECLASEAAMRLGLDNSPSPDVVTHLRMSAHGLWEPIRALLNVPIVVSSGYRAPLVNRAIGGSPTSVHCFGYALDCRAAGMRLAEAMQTVVDHGPNFDQAIFEFGRWLHLGWQSPAGRQRRQALMIFEPNRYLTWNARDPRVADCA